MTNDADANTRAQLRALGSTRLLEFIAAYDSGFGHKPRRTRCWPSRHFAEVAPAEIAVVGDTVHDLVAARAAGAIAIGVLSGPTAARARWSRTPTSLLALDRSQL